MFRKVLLPIILGLASGAATVCARILSVGFVKEPTGAQIAHYSVGVLTVVTAAVAAWNGLSALREKEATGSYVSLLAALTKIVGYAQIPAGDIGLSAYRVATSYRSPFLRARWPLRWPWYKRQQRIARVRLSSDPPRCTIEWVSGKGVVGDCWRARDREVQFLRRDSQYLRCTRDQWETAPADTSMGLSYDEWVTTQRYALILARPVNNGDKYVGCVSLDTTKDAHADKLLAERVGELLGDAATAVGKALGGA